MGISEPEGRREALYRRSSRGGENVERGALESAATCAEPPSRKFGMFFSSGYIHPGPRRPGFLRIESGIPICRYRGEAAQLQVLEFRFFQTELLTDAHTPFREARAVHAGIEILQVEKLVKRAITEHVRGDLLSARLRRRSPASTEDWRTRRAQVRFSFSTAVTSRTKKARTGA